MDPTPFRPPSFYHQHAVSAAAPQAGEARRVSGTGFADVLQALGERMQEGERLVEHAMARASRSDAHHLIALQAGIYRYSESVELAAKLVERTSSGVKSVLQAQ